MINLNNAVFRDLKLDRLSIKSFNRCVMRLRHSFFSHLLTLRSSPLFWQILSGRVGNPFFRTFKRGKKEVAVYMVSNIYTEFVL